jgi:hypothetical protein
MRIRRLELAIALLVLVGTAVALWTFARDFGPRHTAVERFAAEPTSIVIDFRIDNLHQDLGDASIKPILEEERWKLRDDNGLSKIVYTANSKIAQAVVRFVPERTTLIPELYDALANLQILSTADNEAQIDELPPASDAFVPAKIAYTLFVETGRGMQTQTHTLRFTDVDLQRARRREYHIHLLENEPTAAQVPGTGSLTPDPNPATKYPALLTLFRNFGGVDMRVQITHAKRVLRGLK